MFQAELSPYLVPYDGSFHVGSASTKPLADAPSKKACKKLLKPLVKELGELQRVLYAHDQYAVLLIFQAMDAGGKDGTVKHVMGPLNPQRHKAFWHHA